MTLLASQHVVLEAVDGMNGGCGGARVDFVRNLRDGTQETGPGGLGWRIPSRKALVVTDVDWQYVHPDGPAAAGTIQILRLLVENLANDGDPQREFESTITLSSKGEGGVSEAMRSGFVVSSKARICPDISPGPAGPPSGLQHLIVRGYLILDT